MVLLVLQALLAVIIVLGYAIYLIQAGLLHGYLYFTDGNGGTFPTSIDIAVSISIRFKYAQQNIEV